MVDFTNRQLSPVSLDDPARAAFEAEAFRLLGNMVVAIKDNDVAAVMQTVASTLALGTIEIGLSNTLRAFTIGRLLVIKQRADRVFRGADLLSSRLMLGVKQQTIAELLNIRYPVVSEWERCGGNVPKHHVDKLLDFFLSFDPVASGGVQEEHSP